MKKQILNIGKALNRAEQERVFGGSPKLYECETKEDCLVPYLGAFATCWHHICYYSN